MSRRNHRDRVIKARRPRSPTRRWYPLGTRFPWGRISPGPSDTLVVVAKGAFNYDMITLGRRHEPPFAPWLSTYGTGVDPAYMAGMANSDVNCLSPRFGEFGCFGMVTVCPWPPPDAVLVSGFGAPWSPAGWKP